MKITPRAEIYRLWQLAQDAQVTYEAAMGEELQVQYTCIQEIPMLTPEQRERMFEAADAKRAYQSAICSSNLEHGKVDDLRHQMDAISWKLEQKAHAPDATPEDLLEYQQHLHLEQALKAQRWSYAQLEQHVRDLDHLEAIAWDSTSPRAGKYAKDSL